MSRETFSDSAIPATGAAKIPYQDDREIVNVTTRHMTEAFMGQVLGAGGVGGVLAGIPFQPAVIEIINADGAAPAFTKYAYPAGVGTGVQIILGALDATAEAPVLAQVAANNWTATLDTADAPDAETVTVIVYGFRDIAGGL